MALACRSTPAKGGARHGVCSPAVCDGVLHTGILVINGVSTGLIVCRNKQALRRKQLHRLERIAVVDHALDMIEYELPPAR